MKSKSKPDILKIIILVILLLPLGYKIITYIKTEKENKAYLAMATENAVRYVREKYGFEPEILDITGDQKYGYYNSPRVDLMFIKMKYNDKVFYVRADKLKENPYCIDDYQYEEIKSAITDEISKIIPNGNIIDFRVCESGTTLYYLFNKYYSGENINEILDITSGKIEMVFADTDFSESDLPDKLEEWNIRYELTSFDTQERADEFTEYKINSRVITLNNGDYAVYAPYITDRREIKNGERQGLNISFQSCGDFIYSYFPVSENGFLVSSEATAKEMNPEAIAQYFKRYEEDEYISAPITNAYVFNRGYDIYIYYPLEKLKDHDIENIGAAWYSGGGQVNNRGIEKPYVCGDYAVFYLPVGADTFMLVDMSGYDEYIPDWANNIPNFGEKKIKNNKPQKGE